jgi:hypothetical protein
VTTDANQSRTYLTGKVEIKMSLEPAPQAIAGNHTPQGPLSSSGPLLPAHDPATAEDLAGFTPSTLVPCVYIALRCSHCGELRQALSELPASANTACPECGRSCSFVPLASGLTRSKLPFHEIYVPQNPYRNFQIASENSSP